MPDSFVFLAGCFVTTLLVLFFVVSFFELRRLGKNADEKSGQQRPETR